MRDWRFGQNAKAAGGIFGREALRSRYSAAVEREVAGDDLRFWEVYGNVRWAAGAAYQGERARAGAEEELELLAIARRASEMELEALRLIGASSKSNASPSTAVVGGSKSGAGVILDAVARFLEEKAKPGLQDPALSYRALVGASLARSLAAEARGGPERVGREIARLESLVPERGDLLSLRRALVERIRGRALSVDDRERARTLVLETLRESLAVTSPRFDPDAAIE